MNTPNKYSKLIARILSIIYFILLIAPVGAIITSMTEVLNECSGNTSENPSSSNQEATLEWIDSWRQYKDTIKNNESKKDKNDEISSSKITLCTSVPKSSLLSETTSSPPQNEANALTEEPVIVTTIAEMTNVEPVTEVVVQEPEIITETTYVEIIEDIPPEPEPPKIEEPPAPPIEDVVVPEPPTQESSGDESWYYPTLLTHDGYETTWDKENQRILKNYCDQYGVDYELMLAVISKESGYNQWAQSYCGAIGLSQVMPITITQFNWDTGIYYDSYYDVNANLHVGVHTMAACINKYGDFYSAATAYNQGLYSSGVGYYSAYAESILALRDRILALKA